MLQWVASNPGVYGQHEQDSEEDTRLGNLEGWWPYLGGTEKETR